MKKFGFGLMRLPLKDDDDLASIDYNKVNEMVDEYIKRGYNFFDTGYPYHNGLSEVAFRECVLKRYPREDVIISDKMPLFSLEKEEDLERFFNEQLERCGVDYFDYYMLHNFSTWTKKVTFNLKAFEFIIKKKKEGKIKHIGISLHDKPKLLKLALDKYPEIEFVLLQINYLDWQSNTIESRKCYNLVCDYNKDVFIMEPVKGGNLVNIPASVKTLFKDYKEDSTPAEWALRFCGSLDNAKVIFSGVSNMEQLKENLDIFDNFKPLSNQEYYMLGQAATLINQDVVVDCTGCNYCVGECDHNIPIPKYLRTYNDYFRLPEDKNFSATGYYKTFSLNPEYGKASDCDACGDCVKQCPQNIKIPKIMEKIVEVFEEDEEN